jgi:plasmid stabilization system protein ParE
MKVRFTRTAQRDLARIHDYISQDSPAIASRFVARLIERSRQLADNPFAGRETDEPDARVIVEPRLRYFIFYTGYLRRNPHYPHPPYIAPPSTRLESMISFLPSRNDSD